MIDETQDIIPGTDSEEKKFTDWTNPPSVRNLKQDLSDAKPEHDSHVTKVNGWLDNLNITGSAKIEKKKGRSSMVPKLIRKQAEWRYASLSEPFLSTDDVFNTDPITAEDKEASVQNGLVLNNQFNTKIDKVAFIDEYVRAAVDEGTVVCRTGWNYEDEQIEVEVDDFTYEASNDPALREEHFRLAQLLEQSPFGFYQTTPPEMQEAHKRSMIAKVPMAPVHIGSHIETEIKIIQNHPTVEVCNYNNLVIDPSCNGDLSKAKFIIYSFETSISELKKDKKAKNYKNLDQVKISNSNSPLTEPDFDSGEISSFNFSDEPRKKFVAHEYWGFWDIEDDGTVEPIVATWVGDTMIRLEENPFPDQELPFVSVQYLPVRKSIYGEPDGELLEDNQKIIGAVTRGMIDIMGRSANGQQGTRKDALDVTNKRKFDRGLDYEFNSQVDPKHAFHMHTYPEIPRSAHEMLQMQNAEAESLTGVKAFSQGITGNALGDSVGGIKSAMDATAKRELGILRRLAEGVKQIGRKFISMNAEFLSEEETIRITNDEFVTIRRDDLAGKIDVTLTISTAEADNDKARELAFMIQTLGPSADQGIVRIIQADIARLRKMPALAKKIEEYEPQPDPLMIEKQKLEIELLKAQIYNETAKGNENNANANLDNAKAQTEGSKARHLNSTADKSDLDFVEQETGTTQERDLQKAGAQADANKELEAVKHIFNMREKANDKTAGGSAPTK